MTNEEIKVTLGMDVGPLALGLRKADHLVEAFEKSAIGRTNIFEHLFPMASIGGAILTLEKAIAKARDITRLSDEFGVSTSFVQDITNIGMLSGISETKIEKMMGAFLQSLPVGSDVEEEFFRVADAVAATLDPVTKAQIVFDAFGKSGYKMLPILEKGSAGIKELGASFSKFSESDIKSLEEAELAIKQFGNTFEVWVGRIVIGYERWFDVMKESAKYYPEYGIAAIVPGLMDSTKKGADESDSEKELEASQKAAAAAARSFDERKKLDEARNKFILAQNNARLKEASPEGKLKILQDEELLLQHQYDKETSEIKRLEIAQKIVEAEEKIKEIQKKAADEASKAIDKRFNEINSASDKWLSSKAALQKTQHPEFTLEELAQSGNWMQSWRRGGNGRQITGEWFQQGPGAQQANQIEDLRQWAKENAMAGNSDLAKEQWSQADKLFDDLKKKFPFLKDPNEDLKEHAKKSEEHLDELLNLAQTSGINTNPAMGK